jgi:hypothetical protein
MSRRCKASLHADRAVGGGTLRIVAAAVLVAVVSAPLAAPAPGSRELPQEISVTGAQRDRGLVRTRHARF